MKMALSILDKCFRTKNQGKVCIYSIQMISTLEIGQITIWKDMVLIYLLRDRYIKESLKKDSNKDMVSAFTKMEDNMKVRGQIIVKLVQEKYLFLIKSYSLGFSNPRLNKHKDCLQVHLTKLASLFGKIKVFYNIITGRKI